MAEEKLVGKISHFFSKINVGIIELSDALNVGDKVHFKGHATDFEQTIDSMQIDRQDIQAAKNGDAVGIKVADKVKEGDQVFKVIE